MKHKSNNNQSDKKWPVLQITQIEFKRGLGDKWAHGLQKQWNTSMYMCDGYLGGKILRCCENTDKFIIYTEWDSHKSLNNFMLKEEYKWYRITDTDDDVVNVLYERYEVDHDCCNPEMMIGLNEWKSHLRQLGFSTNEHYYRRDRLAGNGLPVEGKGKRNKVAR